MKHQKTAYKFESKHLGEAFMKELVEMGYKQMDSVSWTDNKIHTYFGHDTYNDGDAWFSSFRQNVEHGFQLETQWNEALAHARRQLEPGFKVGDWVVCPAEDPGYKDLLKVYKGDNEMSFGFGFTGEWSDYIGCRVKPIRKATPDEIKSALVKECERRGLRHGNFKSLVRFNSYGLSDHKYHYSASIDTLYIENNAVYQQGKWAEKIEDKFFDWDVEKDESGITFAPDCEAIHFDKETLNTLVYALNFVYDKTVQEVIDELNKIL